jgi:hypothetical protein
MGEDIDIRYICHRPSTHHSSYDLISSSVFVHTQIPVLPYSAILYLVERIRGNCASSVGVPLPFLLNYVVLSVGRI